MDNYMLIFLFYLEHQFVVYLFHIKTALCKQKDRLGGVMVSVLASSAEGRGFDPRPRQTKDIKFGICCFSAKHAAFWSKSIVWSAQSHVGFEGKAFNLVRYCKPSLIRRLYSEGSFASTYKLSTGEVRKAPSASRKP